MRDNLQTVVNYVLEKKDDLSLYMDNIALHARKFPSGNHFTGLTCTAYQNSRAKDMYLSSNFFCTEQSTSPDLAKSKKQVGAGCWFTLR